MISLSNLRCLTGRRAQLGALLTALLAFGMFSAIPNRALAQEDTAAPETTSEAPEAPAQPAESAAPIIPAQSNPALEKKLQSYWSVEKDLPSVERRLYSRDGRLSVGLFAGMLSSEPFYWYIPVGLRATYYFSNYWGVELEGSFMDAPGVFSHNTELSDYLETERPVDFTAAKRQDRFLWRANAMAVWHPLYGKFALLQRKLAHFDLNLAAGLGVVGVDRPDVLRQSTSSAVAPEAVFGLGTQFFATPDLVIRLDGRLYLYPAAETDSKNTFVSRLEAPIEFLLGASYMF